MDQLSVVLSRLALGLQNLADDLSRVGLAAEVTPQGVGALRTADMVASQNIDRSEQSTRYISLILHRLAALSPAGIAIDADALVCDIQLDCIKDLVAGREQLPLSDGSIDLF